jgi:hypothetical protein
VKRATPCENGSNNRKIIIGIKGKIIIVKEEE